LPDGKFKLNTPFRILLNVLNGQWVTFR